MTPLPPQSAIIGPLLKALGTGGMKASDAVTAVADALALDAKAREEIARLPGGQSVRLFARRVRWTRQTAVMTGLIDDSRRGWWSLTDEGRAQSNSAKSGVVISVFVSPSGSLIWADAQSALQYVDDDSVSAVITSPPYPLVVAREYDRDNSAWRPENYLRTLVEHIQALRPKLTDDGSLVLNLGPAFLAGTPNRNPFQHQLLQALVDNLGWRLIDEHFWINPAKPRASPQVTKWRTHCVNQVEPVFILSPTGKTKCCNLRVLTPYSNRHRRVIAAGGELQTELSPSAMCWPGLRYSADNGGSIPSNVHVFSHDKDTAYRAFCARRGLPAHPAMMPLKLAEFFVELTTEPGDIVMDPFGGSAKLAEACLKRDRRFIVIERRRDYLEGGKFRVNAA